MACQIWPIVIIFLSNMYVLTYVPGLTINQRPLKPIKGLAFK